MKLITISNSRMLLLLTFFFCTLKEKITQYTEAAYPATNRLVASTPGH